MAQLVLRLDRTMRQQERRAKYLDHDAGRSDADVFELY
jgi:hypothetical protein